MMTVREFVEKYNYAKDKKTFVSKLQDVKYVNYEDKIAICKKIVEVSCYVDGKYHIDSPSLYLFYVLNLIKCYYSSIDINFKKSLDVFNTLNKYGLKTIMLSLIPATERIEFDEILDMVKHDDYENKNEIHNFISSQIESIVDFLGAISDKDIDGEANV